MRQLLSYYILIIFIGAGLVNGGAIVEIITKTADVHDAGCDCGLEIAILTPKVRMKRTHFFEEIKLWQILELHQNTKRR